MPRLRARVPSLIVLGTIAVFGGGSGCAEKAPEMSAADHAEGLYLEGTSAYLQGDFERAEAAFKQMQTLVPRDPRLPAALGELLLAQGKPAEALAHFEAAAQQDPGRSTNWSRVGFIRAQLGRDQPAADALRRALALNPRDFLALQTSAELALKTGRIDDAVTAFVRAADVSATQPAAIDLILRAASTLETAGRQEDATRLLQSASGRGADSPRLLMALGEALVRARRFDDAIRVLSRAARRSPGDPTIWELVGELQVRQGLPEEARQSYERSVAISDRAIVHVSLARLHAAAGDGAAAHAALERALQSATGEEASETIELARVLSELGRKKDGLALMAALAAEPQNVTDLGLQREVIALAKEVGDKAAVQAVCARVRQHADAGAKPPCP